ncbi:hypothetical protein JCM10207_006121 [Rhodosporidiobolus poonsookiae]
MSYYKQLPPLTHLLYSSYQPGLVAYISSKGRPLEVHERSQGPRMATGVVAGEPGDEFSVHFVEQRTRKPAKGYEIKLYFGEEYITGNFMRPAETGYDTSLDHPHRWHTYSDTRVDNYTVRPFAFSKIATTDDKSKVTEGAAAEDISTVRFKYRRIKNVRVHKQTAVQRAEKQSRISKASSDLLGNRDGRKVDEKADKGSFSLAASYGNLVTDELQLSQRGKRAAAKVYNYEIVDPNFPDLTFTFKIRSQVWLDKTEKERESASAPPPAAVERHDTPPIDLNDGAICLDMDEDEVDRLIEREAAEIAAGKRQADGPHKGPRKRVKREELEASDEEAEDEEDADAGAERSDAQAGEPFYPSDDESGSDGEGYYARGEHLLLKVKPEPQPVVQQPMVHAQASPPVASGSGTVHGAKVKAEQE